MSDCTRMPRWMTIRDDIAGALGVGAEMQVVADAASVGSDAGSIRHEETLIDTSFLRYDGGHHAR